MRGGQPKAQVLSRLAALSVFAYRPLHTEDRGQHQREAEQRFAVHALSEKAPAEEEGTDGTEQPQRGNDSRR